MDGLGDPAAPEQQHDGSEEQEGQYNPEDLDDSEDSNYLPLSEEDVSLGDEEFIVPEDPLDQERFKRQLVATPRSLKMKQQQLKAEHDTLNDRWTKFLAAEEGYGYERQTKSYPKRKLLPQFDDEALAPVPPRYTQADQPDRPLEDGIGRLGKPNTHPPPSP